MLCVECSAPIDSLYEEYKGNHLRLTVCPNCHKVADKYIEYDRVLVFIDLILLKPQAYRHTIYNSMILDPQVENPMKRVRYGQSSQTLQNSQSGGQDQNKKRKGKPKPKSKRRRQSQVRCQIRHFLQTYGFVMRLTVLLLLFEVYICWAYEEKNYVEGTMNTSEVLKKVLDVPKGPPQYLYFLSTTCLESLLLNLNVELLARKVLGFGTRQGGSIVMTTTRSVAVIVTTLLISNTIKLFPIVMLIWPYDGMILNVTRIVVQLVHVLILIEGLHIVLIDNVNNQYWKVALVVFFSEFMTILVGHFLIDLVFSYVYNVSWSHMFWDEIDQINQRFDVLGRMVDMMTA